MRVSTSMMYNNGTTQLSKVQSDLLKTQQQIAANTRVLTPSDDPIAAARALDINQRQSLNTQYADNRTQAMHSLNQEEGALKSLTTLIQNLQTQVVEAGDVTYDDDQRGYIATEMRGTLEEILGLANTRDTSGNYLFSGYKTMSQPFAATSTGASYAGDQGARRMQVDSSRQMAVSDSGDAVFQNSSTSGTFKFDVSGTFPRGFMSDASITNESAITGHTYDVVFDTTGTGTTADPFVKIYSVFDTTIDANKTGTPLQTGTYTSTDANKASQTIEVDGISFTIKGTRADGDTLTLETTKPAENQSMFKTVTDLINLLDAGTSGATGSVNFSQGLAAASTALASALDNVLTIRASVGARLKEIDSLDTAGTDRALQYSSMLSDLVDLDLIKASSDLAQQKLVYEAAQQSFVNITGLSLFNYM